MHSKELKSIITTVLNTTTILSDNTDLKFTDSTDDNESSVVEFEITYALAADQRLTIPFSATLVGSSPQQYVNIAAYLTETPALQLSDLHQLAGIKDPHSHLPADLFTVDSISLREIGFGISLDNGKSTLEDTYVVVGITQSVPLVPDLFTFHDIGFRFTHSASQSSPVTVTAFGQLQVAGSSNLGGTVSLPALNYNFFLLKDESIDIKNFVESLLPTKIDMPELSCPRLVVSGDIKAKQFSLVVVLESDWPLIGTHNQLILSQLLLEIGRTDGDTTGRIEGVLEIDGHKLYMAAESEGAGNGWQFEGGTLDDQSISLNSVVDHLLSIFNIQLPSVVPDIELSHLDISFNTASKTFQFKGESLTPGPVPLGDKTHDLHSSVDITIDRDPRTGKYRFSGSLEADLKLGAATFKIKYSMGQAQHLIKAEWDGGGQTTITVNDILHGMGIGAVLEMPDALNAGLAKVVFEYRADTQRLSLAAQSAEHGAAFLVVGKSASGEWETVFGLAFKDVGKLSDIPDIGDVFQPVDFITIQSASLIVASTTIAQFTMPQLPAFTQAPPPTDGETPDSTRKTVATTLPSLANGASSMRLKKGPSIAAVMDLASSAHNDAIMRNVQNILDHDTLTIQAAWSGTPSVSATLDGRVGIPTGTGTNLALSDVTLEFDLSEEVIVQLAGSISLTIDGRIIDARARLVLDETEAQVTVTIDEKSGHGLPGPAYLQGVHLDEIGIVLGVVFEPPGVDLGLQGKLHIGNDPPKQDDFAMVLEIVEEVPNPLLFSFHMKEISLPKAYTAVSDSEPPDWIKQAMGFFKATDVAFYWADSVVVLPDGSTAVPGFSFHGRLDIFSFKAYGMFQADPQGLAGDAELDPLHLKILNVPLLSITGDGKGIKRLQERVNGAWQTVTAPPIKRLKAPPETRDLFVIQPGGANFRFGKSGVHASAHVSLFDLLSSSLQLDIDEHGLHFVFQESAAKIASMKLECTLKFDDGFCFDASGTFGVHLKGDIGPIIPGLDFTEIHLDVGLDANIELTIGSNPEQFKLVVDGEFEFEGATLPLPTLTLDVPIAKLDDLAEAIWDHIVDKADEIFSDILDIAGHLLEEAGKEIVKIGEEAAKEVEQIGELAVQGAIELEHQAEKVVAEVGKAAEAVAAEAEKIGEEAAQALTDVADEVDKIGAKAAEEAEKLIDAGEQVAEAAFAEAKQISEAVAHEVEEIGEDIAKVATAAYEEAAEIVNAVAAEAEEIIADAGQVATEILQGAAQAARAIEHAAEEVLDEVSDLANKALHGIEDVGEAIGGGIEDAGEAVASVFSGW